MRASAPIALAALILVAGCASTDRPKLPSGRYLVSFDTYDMAGYVHGPTAAYVRDDEASEKAGCEILVKATAGGIAPMKLMIYQEAKADH